MNIKKGSCLCGALTYEIEGDVGGVWMCHCSNCRKASGGTGNAILIVPCDQFAMANGGAPPNHLRIAAQLHDHALQDLRDPATRRGGRDPRLSDGGNPR